MAADTRGALPLIPASCYDPWGFHKPSKRDWKWAGRDAASRRACMSPLHSVAFGVAKDTRKRKVTEHDEAASPNMGPRTSFSSRLEEERNRLGSRLFNIGV